MTTGATTGARAILLDSGDTLVDEATQVRDSGGIVLRADLVPGAGDLVRELRGRGHPLALVADGRTESFRNVLGAHGLWQLFDVHAISDVVGAPKPDPRMFGCALDGLGVQPADYRRTLMVGNHLARDIAGSNALGLQSVWLDWSPRRSKIPATSRRGRDTSSVSPSTSSASSTNWSSNLRAVYRLVLFSHVLGAIVSVGPALTYGMWLALSRREGPAAQAFVSSGIRWIDSRVVTPAFGWQLVSGLLLVLVYRTADFSEPWLASSLVIYGAIALLAVTVVAPRSRRAAAALQAGGLEAQDYVAYRRLMRRLSPFISVGTLAIVFLMVVKPGR